MTCDCTHLARSGRSEFSSGENSRAHHRRISRVPQKYQFVVTPKEIAGLFFEVVSSVATVRFALMNKDMAPARAASYTTTPTAHVAGQLDVYKKFKCM